MFNETKDRALERRANLKRQNTIDLYYQQKDLHNRFNTYFKALGKPKAPRLKIPYVVKEQRRTDKEERKRIAQIEQTRRMEMEQMDMIEMEQKREAVDERRYRTSVMIYNNHQELIKRFERYNRIIGIDTTPRIPFPYSSQNMRNDILFYKSQLRAEEKKRVLEEMEHDLNLKTFKYFWKEQTKGKPEEQDEDLYLRIYFTDLGGYSTL